MPLPSIEALVNAIGSNETECHANLALASLSDKELEQVTLVPGKLQVTQ